MSKRKVRSLSTETLWFIRDYMDSVECGLTLDQFCEMFDTCANTVYGRRWSLRKRGINLPLLASMQRRPLRKESASPAPVSSDDFYYTFSTN